MLQRTRRTNAASPRLRRAGTLALLAAIAIGLPGCLAIKSQTTSQRAPGVVSFDLVVCATDRDRTIDPNGSDPPGPVSYPDCDPEGPDQNTAEGSNSGDMESTRTRAQILVGYRVPAGSQGPQSFQSEAGDMTFNRSPTYEAELNRPAEEGGFPAPAGFHWVGYISTPRTFDLYNDASSRSVSARAEFTLPPQDGGGPFAGSLPWRPVVGFRTISAEADAGKPVDCDTSTTSCVDSPLTERVPTNLVATVSDFGVLAGDRAAAGHEETATVSFPIQYSDVAALGSREFALTATTNVPGTGTSLGAPTVTVEPNTTKTVAVNVRVPAGTRLGSYTVTLSAATGTPAVTRSNTATIEVVDKIAPTIQIGTPSEGPTFALGQVVPADYGCSEELNGSGVKSCSGPVAPGAAIDTGSAGAKTFTVTATDNAGNVATATRSYTVVAPPIPRVTSAITHTWRFFRKHTLVTKLEVTGMPKGTTLSLKCGKRGKKAGCPFRSKRVSVPNGGKRSLKSLFSKKRKGSKRRRPSKLRVGVVLEIQINAPGHIGKVVRFKMRRSNQPSASVLCTQPGTTTPRKVC